VLTLPQDKPFSHVSVKPVPGWTAAVSEAPLPTPVTIKGTTLTKAARTITWTADKDAAIGTGQYQEFSISAGPLPAPGTMVLPVSQTYSDGKVVKWDQPSTAGGEEPEHPAPQFDVTPASSSGDATASHNTVQADAVPTQDEPDLAARGLAGAALALAVVAVGLQVAGSRRRTKTA
jgi:hypothetical protein